MIRNMGKELNESRLQPLIIRFPDIRIQLLQNDKILQLIRHVKCNLARLIKLQTGLYKRQLYSLRYGVRFIHHRFLRTHS